MLRKSFIALSLMLATVCRAAPAPDLVTYEWAVETSPAVTALPTKAPSQINARGCASCKSLPLTVTADTRYFLTSGIARAEVTLTDLKKYSNGNLSMGVFYRPETSQVTRIVIFGVKPADLANLARDKTKR